LRKRFDTLWKPFSIRNKRICDIHQYPVFIGFAYWIVITKLSDECMVWIAYGKSVSMKNGNDYTENGDKISQRCIQERQACIRA
jgi:hypothetical protein